MKFTPMKLIPLTQGKFAQVDDEDFEYLNQWKWYAVISRGTFYAVRNIRVGGRQVQIKMHRQIMGLQIGDEKVVDHIKHDGLDNTKSNLRICSGNENFLNKKKTRSNTTSRYKGVSLKKSRSSKKGGLSYNYYWIAYISVNKKRINIGFFNTELESAKAYNNAAKIHHKEFAALNTLYCNPCTISNNNLITKHT